MIYDHIKNIGLYKAMTLAIDLALDYIAGVVPEVEIGTQPLDKGVKAVVSEYETRPTNELGYEAHRRYIDIQLAVIGTVIGEWYSFWSGLETCGVCGKVKKVVMKVPVELRNTMRKFLTTIASATFFGNSLYRRGA